MKSLFAFIFVIPIFVCASPQKVLIDELLNLPSENRKLAAFERRQEISADLRLYVHNRKLPMATRWKALMLLTEISPKEAIADLQKSAQSPDWYMRNASLVGLESISPERAQQLAHELIADKALVVRSAAVGVLAKDLGPSNRNLFWSEFDKKYNFRAENSLWIRGQILGALAQKPLDEEAPIFMRLLKDKDSHVRLASVQALEKLHGVRLGNENSTASQKVALWIDYSKQESRR